MSRAVLQVKEPDGFEYMFRYPGVVDHEVNRALKQSCVEMMQPEEFFAMVQPCLSNSVCLWPATVLMGCRSWVRQRKKNSKARVVRELNMLS